MKEFGDVLWQVFVPGSFITHTTLEKDIVLVEVLTDDWKPLKGERELFTYFSRENRNSCQASIQV